MSGTDRTTARVGVRELRQNLSVYLRRVKAGETLQVTEHGRIVARLTPAPLESLSPYERMKAEGRIRPATVRWEDIPPPVKLSGRPLSEVLQEMREEDDR